MAGTLSVVRAHARGKHRQKGETRIRKVIHSDSADFAVDAMQAALSGPLQPPAHIHLRDADWPFWNAIVEARAASTWNAADLAHAANLARCQADIDRIAAELEAEGDVIENAKGTPVVNPKHALMETLSRRAVALSRVLHVHAEATKGRSRDAGNKAQAESDARDAAQTVVSDDLIGRSRLRVV